MPTVISNRDEMFAEGLTNMKQFSKHEVHLKLDCHKLHLVDLYKL